MATEIERKFLIIHDHWRDHIQRSLSLRQGYLQSNAHSSVRVRISDDSANLNIKSATVGVSRMEFEYPIPLEDARQLLDTLCHHCLEKTRHLVQHGDHLWEIDEFHGANSGLIVAEVELSQADETIALPDWVGQEVSGDIRYYNSELAKHPYQDWETAHQQPK